MNAQIGEIFRACYRYGQASHSDKLRDAKKILFYAKAEIDRLEKSKPIESNNDGWIEWHGGECPIYGIVQIKRRGFEYDNSVHKSWTINWLHGKREADGEIVAYRVIPLHKA